jgi:hypothetical protein
MTEEPLAKILAACEGWCSEAKAERLIHFIREHRLKLTVEIGVFQGRSLFPQALAHKLFTDGVAYGIDPWDLKSALQEGFEEINAMVETFDFAALYKDVMSRRTRFGLENHCRILRMKSTEAVELFADQSIQLLHIDGNHETKAVCEDVALYLPKMADGGWIWFDDASWLSIAPAVQYAADRCVLFERFDADNLIFQVPREA